MPPRGLAEVLDALKEHGVLLATDARLPSVTTLVAGEPVHGSWWAHPKGRAIFAVLEALEDHPDALATRLVEGKVTFVHRRLWRALRCVGEAREPWQLRNLDPKATALLKDVDAKGAAQASGAPALQLEKRLLVVAREVHTERGTHAKMLETWERWAERAGQPSPGVAPGVTPEASKADFERLVAALPGGGAEARLPWQALAKRGRIAQD